MTNPDRSVPVYPSLDAGLVFLAGYVVDVLHKDGTKTCLLADGETEVDGVRVFSGRAYQQRDGEEVGPTVNVPYSDIDCIVYR